MDELCCPLVSCFISKIYCRYDGYFCCILKGFIQKGKSKIILMAVFVLLVLAVVIGVLGTHGLKPHLSNEMMQVCKTGVEYHFYNAWGLLLVGGLAISIPSILLNWSAICLVLGIILFPGSLYLLSITGIKWLGAVTPFWSLGFIAGWVLLFVAVWKKLPIK